jgi:mannose-6-phosphate isomerase
MRMPDATRTPFVTEVLAACDKVRSGPFALSCQWAVELGRQYPGDIGAVCSLLLNCITLQPGQALFLAAGNLHAYLRGVGIELMASSDNVLRGGLTPKHIDVDELLRVLDFNQGPVSVLEPEASKTGEHVYTTPAPEFRLSHLMLTEKAFQPERHGPEILLVTEGQATVSAPDQSWALKKGQSLFVSAADSAYAISGAGKVFRATVNA